mgnify:FL=1
MPRLFNFDNKGVIDSSIYLFVVINFYNFLNYLFQFISARMLGSEGYSSVAVFMGLVYVLIIPSSSILTIISRYTTLFISRGESRNVGELVRKTNSKFIKISLLLFILLAFLSPFVGKFLNIDAGIIVLSALLGIAMISLSVYRGAFQGMKRFRAFGISYLSEGITKVAISIALIMAIGVYGAIIGYTMSFFISLGVSFLLIKDIFKDKEKNFKAEGIYGYSLPVLITLTGITLLYSLDLILIKRFFPADIAGKYAAIALLGKAIFFATNPISMAAFPFMSEHYDTKNKVGSPLMKALISVALIGGIALTIYALFPSTIVKLFFGQEYMPFVQFLVYPGAAMFLLSISNMFAFYNLSNNNYKANYIILLAIFIQIILISMFHATIMQFMTSLLATQIFLIIMMGLIHLIKR